MTGIVRKMPVMRHEDGTVRYTLRLEQPKNGVGTEPASVDELELDSLIDRAVTITHTGKYNCVRCGRPTNRTFGEGFCFPCFRDAPEAAECIVKPELCEAHLGRGRDPEWEAAHHNQPHVVYLAVSSAVKVGVTRQTQVPTRWIDQGAAWAVMIAEVPYRQLAGLIEVALKDLYTDRTAWQRMLKNEPAPEVDLEREAMQIAQHLNDTQPELAKYLIPVENLDPITLRYPVADPPTKVKSVNLGKVGGIESVLRGARGQYLIFEGGAVLNVRRHSGFFVTIEA